MNADTLLENFEIFAEAPGGIDRLRDAILELATNGHLVERDESEPKQKFVPINGPSPIPSNWVWTSLAEIASYGGNGNFSSSDIRSTDWVLDLEDIEKGTSRLIEKVIARERPSKSNKAKFNAGDVLYGKLRPYLNKVLVADSHGYCTTEIVPIVPNQGIDPHWLRISLKSPRFLSYVNSKSYGMKMPRLGTKDALLSIHAVPPLAEQKRIVAKVDELMALCDKLEQKQKQRDNLRTATRRSAIDAISTAITPEELEAAWKRINNNWKVIADTAESVGTLRQLLLDLAVRGLLVSQSQNDQAAIDFLKKFSKKPERLPDVRGDVPFQIPKSWIWVTFSEISKNRDSERIPLSKLNRENRKGEFDYYGASGVIDSIDDYLFDKPLLLIGEDGANLVNRSTPIAFIATGKYWVNNHAHVIDSFDTDALKYLALAINQMDLKQFLTGTAQPKLNQAKLNKIPIPLPPHAEQKRIVAKVEELMALCDQLEARLKVRSEVVEKFARSVVSAA